MARKEKIDVEERGESVKSLYRIVLLVCLSAFFSTEAFTCTCEFMETKKRLRNARAVFIGEVVEISHNDKNRWATVAVRFKVDRYWKGVKEPYITVVTAPSICCTCGLKVQVGTEYLIFAFANETDQIETNYCASAPLDSKRSAEELKVIGEGKTLE